MPSVRDCKALVAAVSLACVVAGRADAQQQNPLPLPAPTNEAVIGLPGAKSVLHGSTLELPRPPQPTLRAKLQDRWLGYSDEFYPVPLGGSVYGNARTMVSNGVAGRLVLNDFDFLPNSPQLNLKGQDQLAKITTLLGCSFAPLVIERTPLEPKLAEARRLAVLDELARTSSFPVPPERVIVAKPPTRGMPGVHSEAIDLNQTNRVALSGPPVSTSTSGAAGGTGVSAGGAPPVR
jgi:hypothetical protein